MVNGLGVLGWGVGGIEAEAAMLGQPVSMLIPEVVGFHLTGALKEGITATDLVLTVTQMLRQKGVVGRFVEFFGPGLDTLPLADRATIANMAPEYGATCGFFPIDEHTLDYLRLTGRDDEQIALVRGLCEGAGPVARRRRAPTRCSPTRSSSTWAPSSRRSPARSGRRTGCCSSEVDDEFNAELDEDLSRRRGDPRVAGRGRGLRLRPRRRRHRRDHQLHQHLQPLGAGRRRPRRPQGARARA